MAYTQTGLIEQADGSIWHGGAQFSDCDRYRYRLWRSWKPVIKRRLAFIMLNPSTATHDQSDPTVTRCINRAIDWGFDSVYVCNIFSLRSTDPSALKRELDAGNDPVGGPLNNVAIVVCASRSDMVIAAWGQHGNIEGRGDDVREMLTSRGIQLYALKVNQDGQPGHPLYLPRYAKPKRLTEAR